MDDTWTIPHFEKMLYDNGPLLGLYADAWAHTRAPLFQRAAEMTVAWLEREMTGPEGMFYSALDADSEGEEGRFYVWTPEQLRACLDADEYVVAACHWGLDRPANFEGRAWHLHVAKPLDEVAAGLAISASTAAESLRVARAKLFQTRAGRTRPGLDDKVLTAWNALAIRGLARAARRLGRADWLDLARRALDALRERVWLGGRLFATWKGGEARLHAYLDDHAFLLAALIEAVQAGYRPADMDWACRLADALLTEFEDTEAGGFYFTCHDHEALIQRPKPGHDGAMPSGNGLAALCLNRLGQLSGEMRYVEAARRCLRLFQAEVAGQPLAHASLLMAAAEQLCPPRVVVLRGPAAEVAAWSEAARRCPPREDLTVALPGMLPDVPAPLAKPARDHAVAYICEGANCLPEVVQMAEFTAILSG